MALLSQALAAPECVFSVMGAHAGEDAGAIFDRKIEDCARVGCTFWVAKSAKARPEQVQEMCDHRRGGYTIFIGPASIGGARPTSESDAASMYSADRIQWYSLPDGLGPVTGQMDYSAAALVFDQLTVDVAATVDLWDYAERTDPSRPLKFILGLSTVCAVKKDMSAHPQSMKSSYRRVVAVARLTQPFAVWVR